MFIYKWNEQYNKWVFLFYYVCSLINSEFKIQTSSELTLWWHGATIMAHLSSEGEFQDFLMNHQRTIRWDPRFSSPFNVIKHPQKKKWKGKNEVEEVDCWRRKKKNIDIALFFPPSKHDSDGSVSLHFFFFFCVSYVAWPMLGWQRTNQKA